MIEAACPNGSDPCIVSGQGTTSAVINFGSNIGENYRVMCIPFDANPGTLANPSDACYAEISLFPTTTLPIEWGYFKLTDQDGNALVQWQTLSETNNSRFDIQKSSDNELFNTVETIPGAGNSNAPIEYSWLDENVETGVTYYRIRQVDYDGKESFSKVLSIINENPSSGIVANTFFSHNIVISTELDIVYPVSAFLYDLQGRQLFSSQPFVLFGGSSISLQIPDMPDGVYFLQISGNGVDKKMRVVKSNDAE
ncbi:hypothetical protein SDC9_63400 [bioreactor metagenome]|uniref:Secretion system C-terminal sorting domain-containing protein n=1 Tax=bioreactor metagenome TaxID=1076179 RepID=A0A644XMM5_9ZZZZ